MITVMIWPPRASRPSAPVTPSPDIENSPETTVRRVPVVAFTDEMRNDDVGWCWLSPPDLASMVVACLSSDETFGIFLVASCQAMGHWDLSNTVGWEPRDQPGLTKRRSTSA